MRTLITNGTGRQRGRLVPGRRPRRRRDDRGGGRAAWTRRHRPRPGPVIDAAGRLVIPGGIDVAHPHGAALRRHLRQGHVRDRHARRGVRRARRRSSTSPSRRRGQSLRAGLDAWHAKAEGNCAIDYGFHMIMSDVNDETLVEMDQLVAEGVTDFKLFTAYPGVFLSDDGAIFRAMQRTAANGGTDPHPRRERPGHRRRRRRRGRRRPDRPVLPRRRALPDLRGRGHEPRHPPRRGRRRPRLHRPPVRARRARGRSREARDRGAMAFAETCPQYLFLSLDDMGNGFEGAKFVCSPPLRPADHQDDLWSGLVKDDLQVVSHRPLPVRLPRPEGARPGRLPQGPQRAAGCRGPPRPHARRRRRERPPHARALGRGLLGGTRAHVRAGRPQGRHRARARTRTSSSTTLSAGTSSRRRRTTWTSTTRATRVARSRAAATSCCRAARSSSRAARTPGSRGRRALPRARGGPRLPAPEPRASTVAPTERRRRGRARPGGVARAEPGLRAPTRARGCSSASAALGSTAHSHRQHGRGHRRARPDPKTWRSWGRPARAGIVGAAVGHLAAGDRHGSPWAPHRPVRRLCARRRRGFHLDRCGHRTARSCSCCWACSSSA